jgi:methylaspartate mutase epsilon subunit
VTAFEGGAICYNIPYYKDYHLSESLNNWKYVDRLAGVYFEKFGICIDREFFGTLTATLVPPSIAIVVNLLETIIAVQQGVRCISLGYAEQGNRNQDIAAIHVLKKIVPEILSNMGYSKIQINTVFYQYMAAFPTEINKAENLIKNSASTAKLAGATRILTKTAVEAIKIPNVLDNLNGINLVRNGIDLEQSKNLNLKKIKDEESLIYREVMCIFDKVIFLGAGSIYKGVVNAFENGVIDIPFSPSVYNKGKVSTARDVDGAIRFVNPGNLPFSKDIISFHEDKIADRLKYERLESKDSYILIEKDVMKIARNEFNQWPIAG